VDPLDHAVELLDRALAYTRVTLNRVTDADLARPTPCDRWNLGQLLAHMEDALDAFAEGSHGAIDLDDRPPALVRVRHLQHKACALLAAWSRPAPPTVQIGEYDVATELVALTAAIDITVHGWDVAQAVGADLPIPPRLARDLLVVADRLVTEDDRGTRFAAALDVPADASDERRLLGFLGRHASGGMPVTEDKVKISRNRHPGGAGAS
jgi:uncharacterized protein (TIGR03086 family)